MVALTMDEFLILKKKGHFRVQNVDGRPVITVHRTGQLEETIFCLSPGHANQVKIQLSDEGLTGFIEGAL